MVMSQDIGLREVRLIEHTLIPLSDGVSCAAKIWLPVDAETDPVPAILELIPYRKRDGTIFRDTQLQPVVAARGYAYVRVDIRGSGESTGTLDDEYLPREQQDALELIEWIAAQSWCTGALGMTGISWGGFNALQVAALRPPALKAIITQCSTDDRYADDVHYMGGCQILENIGWAADRFVYNVLPPDPQLVGEAWREMWQQRLDAHYPWIEIWLAHQTRDEYWKHGSVCEDYGAIDIPVYAVSGWYDSYSNAVPRMLANLSVPRKGLIGPWTHSFPDMSEPGPTIGFLHESVRWWDQWLKGIDTGIMDEPMYRVWMLDTVEPKPFFKDLPGRWVAEPTWPSAHIAMTPAYLGDGRLVSEQPDELALPFRSPQTAGIRCGRWGGYGGDSPDLATDQRVEDGTGLCFDGARLTAPVEIMGAVEIELEFSSDQEVAVIAAKLCDVAPDGTSALVSYGVLNLTHRDSHEFPTKLEPGKRYRATVRLNDIAQHFAAGHRIRISLATSHWPVIWPAPKPVTLTVYTGASRVLLPIRPPRASDAELPSFREPELAPAFPATELSPETGTRTIHEDVATGETTVTTLKDWGSYRLDPIGIEASGKLEEIYTIRPGDPLSAQVVIKGLTGFATADVRVEIKTEMRMSATESDWLLDNRIEASEDGKIVYDRRFVKTIPRNLL
jgi:putative CocE/NonD family hydrolase